MLLSVFPVGTQRRKETLLLSVRLKCFAQFKSRVSFVAASYTQDAQQFSCLWPSFMDREDFFEGRGCYIK